MRPLFALTLLSLAALLASCQSVPESPADSQAAASPDASGIDRSSRPPAGPVPEASFPEYETVVLDSGLTLYLVESDRKPTVTYSMMIRSGSLFDGEKAGLAELLADMLDKGVEGMSGYELASEIDFIGGSIGASATSDFTTVSVSGLSRYKETLLETLASLVTEPTFPEEELAKLKQRYMSNLASERQDPSEMADLLRRKLVYGNTGYGAIKTEESIAAISREDLLAYRERHFIPNNASLAIVGDFDSAAMARLARQVFRDWKRAPVPEMPELAFPEIEGVTVHIVNRPGSVQSAIRVAQPSIERAHPDALPLRLLMSILGGGGHGRMYRNLREDKGYTYGAFSYAANAARYGAIVTALEVRNDVTAPAVGEVLSELRRMRQGPIEAEEIAMNRKYLIGGYTLSLEEASETATRVQEIDVYGLEPDFYREYVATLASLTGDDLEALARARLASENLVVAVVGDAATIAEPLRAFGPVTIYDDRLELAEQP